MSLEKTLLFDDLMQVDRQRGKVYQYQPYIKRNASVPKLPEVKLISGHDTLVAIDKNGLTCIPTRQSNATRIKHGSTCSLIFNFKQERPSF